MRRNISVVTVKEDEPREIERNTHLYCNVTAGVQNQKIETVWSRKQT